MRPGIHFPVAYFEPPQSAATSSRSQNKRERLFWIYYTIKRFTLYGIIGMCRLRRHAIKFQRVASERRHARGIITALRLLYHKQAVKRLCRLTCGHRPQPMRHCRIAVYGVIGMCRLRRHAMKFQRVASERRHARGIIAALRLLYRNGCQMAMEKCRALPQGPAPRRTSPNPKKLYAKVANRSCAGAHFQL